MFVLDTNTIIYFFKGMGGVADRLLSTAPTEVALPTVVLYELETGIAKSEAPNRRRHQLNALIAASRILPFGLQEARAAASIRADLEIAGTPIGPLDNLIAGTALAHNGVLVTRNTREFGRVAGLDVVDWYD
jgi:tRNA(fMet)-specific endonuclease VapC